MKTILLSQEDTRHGSLVLVNAAHPLGPDGKGWPCLMPFGSDPYGHTVLLEDQAGKMMRHLLAAAGGDGEIVPVSGYRSRRQQEEIFEDTRRSKGEAFTRQYVAMPGCSEHETGLALDVTAAGQALDFICPSFPDGGVFRRFRRLAADYGFVERYPAGKSELTGIAYEPWHFRYVGWPHSLLMERQGWALEEYIGTLAGYSSLSHPMAHCQKSYSIQSYTVPVAERPVEISLPERVPWQLSGNNMGGVVVTLWQ